MTMTYDRQTDGLTSGLCLLWIAVDKSVKKSNHSEICERIAVIRYLLTLHATRNDFNTM